MVYNYIKIAMRNLLKYRFISFINLFGLTIGLTCCLLIFIYIKHELSYDRYNTNADRIYRVTRTFNNQEGVVSLRLSTVSPPFGHYMPGDFPEIQKMTRLLQTGPTPIRYKEKKINEKQAYFADENLVDVFTVKVLKGNPKTALSEPYSVMLTEENARKYFGDEDPMDKTLRFDGQFEFKVTGIYKEFPTNAHMHPGLLLSFNSLRDSTLYGEQQLRTNWGNNAFFTYLMVPENFSPERMIAKFPAFIDRRMNGQEYVGQQASKFTSLGLQKLTDIHLHSHTDYEAEENGDINRVYIFSAIALFILLIACINYMNLSTARSMLRAKEIGIRKVVGAQRKEIIAQFLTESVVITFLSLLLAIGLTAITLPLLTKLYGHRLSMSALVSGPVLLAMAIVPFAVGLLSGIYPSLFMSAFQPIKVLKGLFKVGGKNISFRQVLVTAQFAISIILIISTVVVFKQLRFMQQRSLGYNKDHIVTLPFNNGLNDRFESFRNDLMSQNMFKNVTRSSRIPTGRLLDSRGAQINRGDSMMPVSSDIKYVAADQYFTSTYEVKVVAGRGFSTDFGTDTSSYVVNEAAVSAMGFKNNQDIIGQNLMYGGLRGQVVGVVNDFHFESMHQKIVPLLFLVPRGNQFNRISVKIAGSNVQAALAYLERTWQKFLPDAPYEYTFLDENFEQLYNAEQKQGLIFTIFAMIAIFIACLGLFGLSAFTITQRIKEIGIRKVLGADVSTIVVLLSRDFLKLVGIGAVIAFPVAWYAMNSWLQDFAYRSNLPWWVFVSAAVVAAAVALITISFQAIKAAVANPVKSLRSE